MSNTEHIAQGPVDLNANLLPCPFCDGEAEYATENVRVGYGEYETTEKYHVVKCKACHSNGRRYHQKHLVNFTSRTVSDFRNNPLLRAKVEDEYEAYCQQTRQMAIEAWNRRDLAPQPKPAPVLLTYDEFIAAEEHGARLFQLRPGVSGQQMTEQDDVSWWVWRAIESAVLRKNGIGGE